MDWILDTVEGSRSLEEGGHEKLEMPAVSKISYDFIQPHKSY